MRRLQVRSLMLFVIVLAVLCSLGGGVALGAGACTDSDGDGYFVEPGCGPQRDCNDDDDSVHPGALEVCDGRDGDCNGVVDDDPACDRSCDNPEALAIKTRVSSNDSRAYGEGSIAWVGDGWVVAYTETTTASCTRIALQRLSPDGDLLGGPVVVSGDTPGTTVNPTRPWLAWTGSELGVGWLEVEQDPTCFGAAGEHRAYFRRYTSSLVPLSVRVRLGCQPFTSSDYPRPVWARASYGAVWNDAGGLRFTTVDRQNNVADACGTVISEDNFQTQPSIAWNDEYFGITWSAAAPNADFITIFDEIYFRRIDESSILVDPTPTRVTFDDPRSQWNSVVWADGEWAVSWADTRDSALDFFEVYFARLDALGAKVDPPGDVRVTCCNDDVSGTDRFFNRLTWTGEEFGLGYLANNHPSGTTGDVLFQRIDSSGSVLGSAVLVTPDTARQANRPDVAWNGNEYGFVWDDVQGGVSTTQLYFGRVGCNCTDDDFDNFTTCAGGDCDDGNPLINPLQIESCLDGADNNCDGSTDCQDTVGCPASGGALPGAVGGLLFAGDKQTLSWQVEPESSVYDVLGGDLDELRTDADFSRAECLVWRHPSASYVDAMVPAIGTGRYYLVRGKADQCRLGTWGSPLRDQVTLRCP